MVDIGYEGVDLSAADDYVLPPSLYANADARRTGGDADRAAGPEGGITLGDDILRMPLVVVDRDGNVVRVIPPLSR